MSQCIRNGQGLDVNVLPGHSLLVSSILGSYDATQITGTGGTGLALATASTGGATYGPYASGATIRLRASADGVIEYDSALVPAMLNKIPAFLATDISGNVTGLVSGDRNYLVMADRSKRGAFAGTQLDILGGTWAVTQTAAGGAAVRSSAYPIRTQPGVTPLLVSGTSNAGSQYVRVTQALASSFINRDVAVTVPVFIPDYTKVTQIAILLSSDGFASKFWQTYYTPEFSGLHMIGLSERITQGIAGGQQYTGAGSIGTEEAITHVRIQMTLANTVSGSISIGQPIVGAKKKAQILMSVDDGEALIMRRLDSNLPWSPYEYATRSGIKLSFFLISSLLNTAGYLTTADVARIVADGHRVYPHGAASLAGLANDAARRADVEANIAGLEALGIGRSDLLKCYAYPNGVYEVSSGDTSIFQIMRDAGFVLARTAARRAQIPVQCGFHRPYMLPILGYYEDVGGGGETAAEAVKLVNDLVVVGGLGVFMFHKFVVGTPVSDLEIQQSQFITLCDQLVGHMNGGALESVTPHDMVTEYGLSVPTIGNL